jgi:2-phosphoglycerate kinase
MRWVRSNTVENGMIIIISGPLGVGKTEVAYTLIEKFDRAVMLDGDYLGAVHPQQKIWLLLVNHFFIRR